MTVFQLIYRSQAAVPFSEESLLTLLEKCREVNSRQQITGILLYGNGYFLQLLEGNMDVVCDLYYNHIANDPRHKNLTLLYQMPVKARLYPERSMAFRALNPEKNAQIMGFTPTLQDAQDSGRDLLAPLRLLEMVEGFALELKSRYTAE